MTNIQQKTTHEKFPSSGGVAKIQRIFDGVVCFRRKVEIVSFSLVRVWDKFLLRCGGVRIVLLK